MKDLTSTTGCMGAMPGSETLAALEKGIELEAQGIKVYMMSVGEPDFDTPEIVKAAAWKAMEQGETKYTIPAGIIPLREACARELSATGVPAKMQNVIITPGGKFGCSAAICALCGPGDEVVIPVPYWVSHLHLVRAAGATPVLVPTYPENNFELTASDLEKYITERTRLVILCSPSNPTGTVWRRKALQELADCAVKKNFMILSDEVYEKLVYDEDYPHIPIASFSPEAAEHTITVRSFSKSHAMTGWRCGYLSCPDWLFAKINALQTHFLANVTTFAQFGALQALQDDGNSCELMRREFARRRDIICELLSQIPDIDFVRPTGAFYVFVDISKFGIPSAEFCYQLMESAHVALAPGCGFGADGFVRISYACSEETLREAVKRFAGFCNSLPLKK